MKGKNKADGNYFLIEFRVHHFFQSLILHISDYGVASHLISLFHRLNFCGW